MNWQIWTQKNNWSIKFNNPFDHVVTWSTLCLNVPNVHWRFMPRTDAFATTIKWALVELLKHPKVMKKTHNELNGVVGDGRFVDENDLFQLKYL